MADTKLSALGSQTGAALASGDLFLTVDVSDTSMAASGTDKNLTYAQLQAALGTLYDALGSAATAQSTAETYADTNKLAKSSNLSDVASQQTALNNLAGAVTNNRVLAGNGSNVTLRALLAADLPSLDASKVTTGTFNIALIPTGTDGTHVPLGGVITAGGPQGDASHTQVLTWNAAGQVTTVTNTAIGSLNTSVLTAGSLGLARGGTNGTDAPSAKTNLKLGYGSRIYGHFNFK